LLDKLPAEKKLLRYTHERQWRNIFHPNFPVVLFRDGVQSVPGSKLGLKVVKAMLSPSTGKVDLRLFLKNTYGMKVVKINTALYEKKVASLGTRSERVRRPRYKKAWIYFLDDQPAGDKKTATKPYSVNTPASRKAPEQTKQE
jgi:ribosomal protein L23